MNAVAFSTLNDVLRERAKEMIADQVTVPEIQRATNLRESTIRWIAFKAGLTLMTNRGPTKDEYKHWRKMQVASVTISSSPNYAALAAHLRW